MKPRPFRPSARRLRQARADGKVLWVPSLVQVAGLGGSLLLVGSFVQAWATTLMTLTARPLPSELDAPSLVSLYAEASWLFLASVAALLAAPLVASLLVGPGSRSLMSRPTSEYPKARPARPGAWRAFAAVAAAAMITGGLYALTPEVLRLADAETADAGVFLVSASSTMALFVGLPLLLFVVGDFVIRFTDYRESLMMTREEWEEDRRATAASPIVRRALWRRFRAR